MTSVENTFKDSYLSYHDAGWPAVMPVPSGTKSPPPPGYTGADGMDTSAEVLETWAAIAPDSSIALRMPDGVIGLDVDHYKDKTGGTTLAELCERWGELPPTWRSSAREEPSGIRFYRVPFGRYRTKFPDIEVIQRHHRYAVVWPSPHSDAEGIYRWYGPDGSLSERVPSPEEFPYLPAKWVEGLKEGASEAGPAAADKSSGFDLLDAILNDQSDPCHEVEDARDGALKAMSAPDAGSRHDSALGPTYKLVNLGAWGHPGAGTALGVLKAKWDELFIEDPRPGEWEKLLLSAAQKSVTDIGGCVPVPRDPCLLTEGLEVQAPAPADDRLEEERHGDDEEAEGIEPPVARVQEFNLNEVLGTERFDPQGGSDQVLAEAALERTRNVVRYAGDAGVWVANRGDLWAPEEGDQASWAITKLATLMPPGDPLAEPGTDEKNRAERKKKFMNTAGSKSVATRMKDIVLGGTHPSRVIMSELDAEPWLLWAGGIPWDLRQCGNSLVAADLDPTTPHLQSAAVRPDMRETPLWDALVAAVWPDPAIRAWAVRVLSIALAGYPDAAIPILLGETRRGKSSVVALIMSVLGNYAHSADPRLLGSGDNSHASIIYALKGRRLSFIDEGPREGRWAQEALKRLTGGTPLTGNRMRENPITFSPTHTLVLTANEEPALTDPAVRARVRLLPCRGDIDEVRERRQALGAVGGKVWEREAPGILAKLMAETAQWLADQQSASQAEAPESIRYLAEEVAAEQDVTARWLAEETVPDDTGTRSRDLFEHYVQWCKDGNVHGSRILSETKWGRDLTKRGFGSWHTRGGKYRPLKLRTGGSWTSVPNSLPSISASCDGLGPNVTGCDGFESQPVTPQNPRSSTVFSSVVTGVTGYSLYPEILNSKGHIGTEPQRAAGETGTNPSPVTDDLEKGIKPQVTAFSEGQTNPSQGAETHHTVTSPLSHRYTTTDSDQIQGQEDPRTPSYVTPSDDETVIKPKKRASRLTEEEKARRKAERDAKKATEKALQVIALQGGQYTLPAMALRDGTISSVEPADAENLLATSDVLTVDVEHTGYDVGHKDYSLRTVQLGTAQFAFVFDPHDKDQAGVIRRSLQKVSKLHAHSATADLIPLAQDGLIDIDEGWSKMYDTVIAAKLADPQQSGSDPRIKQIAAHALGDLAVSPAADAKRSEVFRAANWLTQTSADTPIEKSGWAQIDPTREAMVWYAASDVLDTHAIAETLPWPEEGVLERERLAQRMSARVTHEGIRIDESQVHKLQSEHEPKVGELGQKILGYGLGIDNPNSPKQLVKALTDLGAELPRTEKGNPSANEDALESLVGQYPGTVIDSLVRDVLEFRSHSVVLSNHIKAGRLAVEVGDGRVRPTIYTLEAATGRFSSQRPNAQNIPKKGGFRSCWSVDPGEAIIAADFSGVEIRVAAALSQDPDLIRFILEEDAGLNDGLHWKIAREVWGNDVATKDHRATAKSLVFGDLYGGGIPTLAKQAGCDEATARRVVEVLKALTPRLRQWIEAEVRKVRNGQSVYRSYSGRPIHLPKEAAYKVGNYLIQGSARELLVDGLVEWNKTKWRNCRFIPVHDELVLWVPENEAEEASKALVECMTTELYGVPIVVEADPPTYAWQDG